MKYINKKLEKFNSDIKSKKIAIIGIGVSNIPIIEYFEKSGLDITVFDERSEEKIPKEVKENIRKYNVKINLGADSLKELKGFDIIFRSPSCMPTRKELREEKERGAIVTTEIEMFMKLCPAKIIGVTGSDGKTTTTSLIYSILKQGGYNCFLGGNIGTPLFTKLNEITPEDFVVLELSSFQLMKMNISPEISVITNITPNHLNVHSSYEEYIDAKSNIFKYQTENGKLVLNHDNTITKMLASKAPGKVVFFSSKEKLEDGVILDNNIIKICKDKLRRHIINTEDIIIRGNHNYENICAAIAATEGLVDIDNIVKAIKSFKGVEHRIELVREINGVKWYNDSIGTSPTRTIAGINSFKERIVLIAGGYDKKLDYTPIAKPILDRVDALILIGDTATKIFDAVKEEEEKENKKIKIYMCSEFKEIVETAYKIAKPGEVVLFSPASASFDMFKNFEERGNKFKELVNNL